MKLVLVRGLPGSGKTTIARTLTLIGFDHHEADHYFERDGVYKFVPTDLPIAHETCLQKTRESLNLGKDCVVSNTFTTLEEMQSYLDLAKDFRADLKVVVADGSWDSIHSVPSYAIERMKNRWQEINL